MERISARPRKESTEAKPVNRPASPAAAVVEQVAAPPSLAPMSAQLRGIDPRLIMSLQRAAGNSAVAGLLDQHSGKLAEPAPPESHTQAAPGLAPTTVESRPRGRRVAVQRSEAKVHEQIERVALTEPGEGGDSASGQFSDQEADAVYFGNWQRDLSQLMISMPADIVGEGLLFEVVNFITVNKFGRELNRTDFGVYSPREHIDDPAGQMNAELLQNTSNRTVSGTGAAATAPEDVSEQAVHQLFTVNSAGLPAYLGRSIQYVEEEFSKAADGGRTETGLMHFGNGLHTVEDYFAHSNWVEIAVGSLIKNGKLKLDFSKGTEVDSALQKDQEERTAKGLDAVGTLAGQTEGGRPILTTGTYVLSDTFASIAEFISSGLRDFEPFEAKNKKRGRATTERLLAYYEARSGSGAAGQIISETLKNLATTLSKVPVIGKAIGSARLKNFLVGAAGRFHTLHLAQAYAFVAGFENALDDFFEDLEHTLQKVPGFETVQTTLKLAVDRLRHALAVPIMKGTKFVAELIEKGFTESQAKRTNIDAQLKSQVKNPHALQQLEAATPAARIAMLANPTWCAHARIDLSGSKKDVGKRLDKINAMSGLPEWQRKGPSHTEIAKDHADSPFFGTVSKLQELVDLRMRNLMVEVWQAEAKNQQTLTGDYGQELQGVKGRAKPGTPDEKMTPKERLAEREAAKDAYHYPEAKRKEEGQAMLDQGGVPEAEESAGAEGLVDAAKEVEQRLVVLTQQLVVEAQHLTLAAHQIPAKLRSLARRLDSTAPAAAAELRRLADEIPAGIDGVANELSQLSNWNAAQRLAKKLHVLAKQKGGLADRAGKVLRGLAGLGVVAEQGISKELMTLASSSDAGLQDVSRLLDRIAAALQEEPAPDRKAAPVKTAEWAPEFSASHGMPGPGGPGMSDRDNLFGFVRQVINHPESNPWWEAPLMDWCSANEERLKGYILARNAGQIHRRVASGD